MFINPYMLNDYIRFSKNSYLCIGTRINKIKE